MQNNNQQKFVCVCELANSKLVLFTFLIKIKNVIVVAFCCLDKKLSRQQRSHLRLTQNCWCRRQCHRTTLPARVLNWRTKTSSSQYCLCITTRRASRWAALRAAANRALRRAAMRARNMAMMWSAQWMPARAARMLGRSAIERLLCDAAGPCVFDWC